MVSCLLLTASWSTGCGSGGEELSSTAQLGGPASASLAWDPVGGVFGYYVYYGTQSPRTPGSCAYAQATFTSTPAATVTNLAANTTYYFAVSAYNGRESVCSAELATVTDSA